MRQINVLPALSDLRRHFAVLVMAFAVFLGSVALQPVGAERVPTNGDSHQMLCRALQDSLFALADEYGQDSTSDERALEILANIRKIGATWLELRCNSRYGQISTVLELPLDVWVVLNPLQGELSPDANVPPAGPPASGNPVAVQPTVSNDNAQDEQGGKRKQRGNGGKHGKGSKGGKRHR